MSGNYYDIDDILADGEKIPCRFSITVPGLGYLEGNPGRAIDKDTQLELPIWLAEILAICEIGSNKQSFIDLIEPDFISSQVLNAIKTNSTTVDLHKLLPNFYRIIEKWCTMFNDEQLIMIVMDLLKNRAAEINNYANNTNKSINNDFIYTLDEFEKKLYKLTSDSNKNMRNWLKN